jgi:glutamyl/glutaminyl-tRNA synthetase
MALRGARVVRYAPSPTGELHLGGLRTALFNWLFARQETGGRFLVRIEDTDRAREVPGASERLVETLARFGLRADAPPERQSARRELHASHARALIERGGAYPCFCSSERLEGLRASSRAGAQLSEASPATSYDRRCRHLGAHEAARRVAAGEPHTIRLRAPLQGQTQVQDLVKGSVAFSNATIDDQVLLKSDGFPTYHLASVVDDHLAGVSHVIRGEEWLSSTPKHLALYEYFGWRAPSFAHLPLLLNRDGSKLSKRQKDAAVASLLDLDRDGGAFEPNAILNFVSLLGWSPVDAAESAGGAEGAEGGPDTATPATAAAAAAAAAATRAATTTATAALTPPPEAESDEARRRLVFLTTDALLQVFDLRKSLRKGAVVDMDLLHWINGQHVRALPAGELAAETLSQAARRDARAHNTRWTADAAYVDALVALVLRRVFRRNDLGLLATHLLLPLGAQLERNEAERAEAFADVKAPAELLRAARDHLAALPDWQPAPVRAALTQLPAQLAKRLSGPKPKPKTVMLPVRWAVTGSLKGAELPDTVFLLGRERVLERLAHAAAALA